MRGLVLFAHGSREPGWARPFEKIRERVRAARPECPIELAYLDLMAPTLEEAIVALVGQGAPAITVFPLFLGHGGHLRQDLPRLLDAIRASHPHVPIALETSLGDAPEITQAIAAWIVSKSE
jgi:sirohydrochlorin cobaltochelatase